MPDRCRRRQVSSPGNAPTLAEPLPAVLARFQQPTEDHRTPHQSSTTLGTPAVSNPDLVTNCQNAANLVRHSPTCPRTAHR